MATKTSKKGANKAGAKGGKKPGKKDGAKSGAASASKKSAAKRAAPPRVQEEPKSPMPAQHQEKPGLESEIEPKPRYEAPHYKGSGKLKDRASLVTGGGVPTAGFVYKMVARCDDDDRLVAVQKKSVGKGSIGGRKWPARSLLLPPARRRRSRISTGIRASMFTWD